MRFRPPTAAQLVRDPGTMTAQRMASRSRGSNGSIGAALTRVARWPLSEAAVRVLPPELRRKVGKHRVVRRQLHIRAVLALDAVKDCRGDPQETRDRCLHRGP